MYQCFCHFVCQSFLQLFFQRFAQYVHALPQPLVGFIGVVDADHLFKKLKLSCFVEKRNITVLMWKDL